MAERSERVTLDMPERSTGSAVLDFSSHDAAPAAPTETKQVRLDPSDGSRKTWGYVALGVGGASLLTGIVGYVLASGQRDDLEASCPNDQCPPEFHGQVDTLNGTLTLSLVGYVGAALGLGAGSYLLLTDTDDSGSESGDASWSVWVGAGSGGVVGRF
jgi:hypothetical protein